MCFLVLLTYPLLLWLHMLRKLLGVQQSMTRKERGESISVMMIDRRLPFQMCCSLNFDGEKWLFIFSSSQCFAFSLCWNSVRNVQIKQLEHRCGLGVGAEVWQYVLVFFKGLYNFYCYLLSLFLKCLQYTGEHTVSRENAVLVLREGFFSSSVSIVGDTIKGFCGALLLPTDGFGLSE